ncbi:MAG: HEAT repeat domain-containing protein [Thermodesulfobacteriota bacterium]
MTIHGKPLVRIALAAVIVACSAAGASAQLNLPGMGNQRSTRQTNPGTSDIDEAAKNMRDDDAATRLEAVKALATSQDKEAIEHLIEATADLDPRVKIKAIDALGTLRAADATPVLVQMLYMRESEPWLKQRVLVALGKIGDTRAARPIVDFLARDTDVATRGTAIFALGEIGDPSSVPQLKTIGETSSDESLRRLTRDAIAKIEQKQVNPEVVVKALRDSEEDARPAAASAAAPLAY